MAVNGMHGSEVLNNEIFGEQPRVSELQQEVDRIIAELSPNRISSPKIQESLDRISSLSETLASVGGQTRVKLRELYITTTHLQGYKDQVAILEAHQRSRIA